MFRRDDGCAFPQGCFDKCVYIKFKTGLKKQRLF